MAEDNWKNRSAGMICKTCIFYVPKGKGVIGRCRRNAPTLKGWVPVYPADWCGEHRLNETYLETQEGNN